VPTVPDHLCRFFSIIRQEVHVIVCQVHHFTLYDSTARGFVRPFCLAYVTPDYRFVLVDSVCICSIQYVYYFDFYL